MNTFEQTVNKLNNNQKVALAAILRSAPVPVKMENWTLFATSEAKKGCLLNASGIGAIVAGIGRRTDDDDPVMYLKDEIDTKKYNGYGKNAIAIADEVLEEAHAWAKTITAFPERMPAEVKPKKIKKAKANELPEIED